KVQDIDTGSINRIDTDLDASDVQNTVQMMVESMLKCNLEVANRPVLVIDPLKNSTMQHFNTELLTNSIRTRLIQSRKFRFLDRSTDQALIRELQTQQNSGLTKQSLAKQFGLQSAPDYMLTGTIIELNARNKKQKDVYYQINMELKNLTTGELEWADEQMIRKLQTKSTFGF
ncbi:MAG: penicillin-binding protein activator LpoB, partial [Lentisphaeria bacterium]